MRKLPKLPKLRKLHDAPLGVIFHSMATSSSKSKTRSSTTGPYRHLGESAETGYSAYQAVGAAALGVIPDDTQVFVVPKTAAAEKVLKRSGTFEKVGPRGSRARTSQSIVSEAKSGAWRSVRQEVFEPGARARAILRGIAHAEADLEDAGGAFDIDQVRTLLRGVSRQAVDKRVNEGALLAVPGPSGRRRFPALQFQDDGAVVAGLKEIQVALGFASAWSVLNFLVNAHDMLGGDRPIDALRRGEVDIVAQAARQSGVHGA